MQDQRAINLLINILENNNDLYLQENSAFALGQFHDERVLMALEKALEYHSSPRIRGISAKSLGDIGDPSAIPSLIKALKNDTDNMVKRVAGYSLIKIDSQYKSRLSWDCQKGIWIYTESHLSKIRF
jgi:HEAT repeat protein